MATERTGFLDLSAELRNRIYDLALHSCKPGPLRLIAPTYGTKKCISRFTSSRIFAVDSQGLSPNILATCKQINAEATPVLYGANLIFCAWYQRFWLQYIGNSVQFLRHIETDLKGVGSLPETPKLKALLTVTVRLDYGYFLVEGLRVLIPLVSTMRANRKRERLEFGLRDMFLFIWGLSRADKKREDRLFKSLEDVLLCGRLASF
ncbi:hypothetical protein HII31_00509 [Pseudocercospora fuligena]|uniref:Uncharacterized protein n=1 Tax=Pseudocercospora fuligena TaxID=685502 RepID=A0A8H6RVI3_9PEZI|nr:hypothetical protein HII31_00509 [Pseudocercospora fuligena]